MNITILGTGAYGLALAVALHKNKENNITMWTKLEQEKLEIDSTHHYQKVLPDIEIPDSIHITTDIEEAIQNAKVIIYAIPISFVESTCQELKSYTKENQIHCIATKGIELSGNRFVSEIIQEYIKTKNIAVISGPSFAIDTVKDYPIGLTLATQEKQTATIIEQIFQNTNIQIETIQDIIGTEICGSVKNIMAIACGILEGLHANESTKAMLITQAINHIKILMKDMNGNENTILTYAGIGDLLLTCTSSKSRNYTFGKLLAEKTQEEIKDYLENNTVEGRCTLQSIYHLITNKKLKNPLIHLIYNIVYQEERPEKLIHFLSDKENQGKI